jgi:signal transduction histidine kinase
MLKMMGHGDARVHRAAEVIARQAKHLSLLVDDLLDVSRVTRGLVELTMGAIDLDDIVDGAVEQAQPLLQSRHHSLAIKRGQRHSSVNGDRHRLVQVLVNLLTNAAKYTPEGGAVTLSVHTAGDRVVVEVADNGVGIDALLMPQIFDLFTQATRTPDRAQGGLGIGLALVKTIVTLHGGEVAASSAGPGAGSKFTVSLPIAPVVPDSMPAQPAR